MSRTKEFPFAGSEPSSYDVSTNDNGTIDANLSRNFPFGTQSDDISFDIGLLSGTFSEETGNAVLETTEKPMGYTETPITSNSRRNSRDRCSTPQSRHGGPLDGCRVRQSVSESSSAGSNAHYSALADFHREKYNNSDNSDGECESNEGSIKCMDCGKQTGSHMDMCSKCIEGAVIDEFLGREPAWITKNKIEVANYFKRDSTEERELQAAADAKRLRINEGNRRKRSASNVGSSGESTTENGITVEKFIQTIKKNYVKERIVHDIVDTRDANRHNFVVQKLRELKHRDGFLVAIQHDLPNFRHIHLIHNCNYTNGCRCSFLSNIPFKRRTARNSKILYDLSDEYLHTLFEYFNKPGYEVLKIIFGSEIWEIFSENAGNVIII